MSDTPRTDAKKRGDFVHINFARELERENAALREDKERLDYMEKNVDFVSWMYCGKPHSWDFRGKIDAKRKESQP